MGRNRLARNGSAAGRPEVGRLAAAGDERDGSLAIRLC
jgi:hypothetical protein